MKYLKALIYFFGPLLLILILFSTLNYFDIIPNQAIKYVNIGNIILSSLVCGVYIGKKSKSLGYIEGIKEGLLLFIILFIFNYLALGIGINLKRFIFYLIIIIMCIIGSVIGINKKKI